MSPTSPSESLPSGEPSRMSFPVLFGLLGLSWLVIDLILVGFGFLVGIPTTIWPLFLSAILALLWVRQSYRPNTRTLGILAGAFIASLALSLWIGSWFIDVYADTQWYHFPATKMLYDGWIPPWNAALPDPVPAETFPKAQWIWNAQTYQLTGDPATGKGIPVLILVVTALLSFAAVRDIFAFRGSDVPAWLCALLALVVTCHPIAISQIPAYYIDGQIANILALVCLSAVAFCLTRAKLWFTVFLLTVFLSFSLKFNAAVFSLFLGLPALWPLVSGLKRNAKKIAALAVTGVVIILANWNPYITNTQMHGSPLYPVLATKKVEGWQLKRDYLEDTNNVEAALIGHTSGTYQMHPAIPLTLKQAWRAPWSDEAFSGFEYSPTMGRVIGAYGPFYPFIAALSLLGFVGLLFSRTRVFTITAGLILVSLVVQSEGWHIRYSPQGWLIPVLFIVGLLSIAHDRWRKTRMALATALSTLLLIGVGIVMSGRPDSFAVAKLFRTQFDAYIAQTGCLYPADLNIRDLNGLGGKLSTEKASAHGYEFCPEPAYNMMHVKEFVSAFPNDPSIIIGEKKTLDPLLTSMTLSASDADRETFVGHLLRDRTYTQADPNDRLVLLMADGAFSPPLVVHGRDTACIAFRDRAGETIAYFQSASGASYRRNQPNKVFVDGIAPPVGRNGTTLVALAKDRLFISGLPSGRSATGRELVFTYPIENGDALFNLISRRALEDDHERCSVTM